MTSDVQIKQFELSDQDALLSFLRVVYADDPRKSDPAYWKWHYLENPNTAIDEVPLWIVRDGERIVGQAATIPVELKVEEETRRAIWILDFMVLAEYRGRGLGKRLLMLARESCSTMFALGFNAQSGSVLRSLKWVSMGEIHRYQRFLFPGNALKQLASLGPIREAVNLCYAPFRPRVAEVRINKDHTVREVLEFDASFEDLWQRARVQWPCAVVRSSRHLDWQFLRQPGKKFNVLGIYEREQLLGYVVLFFRKAERGGAPPKVAISDFCYDANSSERVIDELLETALRQAIERRAGSLVTDILDPRVEERLRYYGFWRIKASPPFMVYTPTRQDSMYEPPNWFLTRADSDVSIFEQPNV